MVGVLELHTVQRSRGENLHGDLVNVHFAGDVQGFCKHDINILNN